MLTLRLRINVQQNPYIIFGIFHVIPKQLSGLTRLFGTWEYFEISQEIRNNVHFNFCLQLYNIVSAYLTHNIHTIIMVTHYLLNAIITEQCHEFDTCLKYKQTWWWPESHFKFLHSEKQWVAADPVLYTVGI